MIIIMEPNATAENITAVTELLKEHGFQVIVHEGDVHTVIDALGDKTTLSAGRIDAMDGVKRLNLFVNRLDWLQEIDNQKIPL